MEFRVKDSHKDQVVEFHLIEMDGGIRLVAENGSGGQWDILEITKHGKLRRYKNIHQGLGFFLDPLGRILEAS